MNEIKYPYISKFGGTITMRFNEYQAQHMEIGASSLADKSNHENITREYLANTWGVVESPEHAEFIRGLAVKHGYEFSVDQEKPKVFYFADDLSSGFWASDANIDVIKSVAKQIAIPMPPKSEVASEAKQESPKLDWPQVGDEVLIVKDVEFKLSDYGESFVGLSGVTVCSKFKNNQGYNIVVVQKPNGGCCCFVEELIKKPKTPEQLFNDELHDCVEMVLNENNGESTAAHICVELLSKYNITKKQP